MSSESLANSSNGQGPEKAEWEVLHRVCRGEGQDQEEDSETQAAKGK